MSIKKTLIIRAVIRRVTSGEAHLRGLAPGQHSMEEISQRWRAIGDTHPAESWWAFGPLKIDMWTGSGV